MKLSCLPVSFFDDITSGKMSVAEWARMGAGLKLDAVDLSILFLPERSVKAAETIRSQVEAEGISITMLTTYPDFTHRIRRSAKKNWSWKSKPSTWQNPWGRNSSVSPPARPTRKPPSKTGSFGPARDYPGLVEAAGNLGVRLAYENHAKPGAWNTPIFPASGDIPGDPLPGESPFLGVNFDTGNATAFAADPLAFLGQIVGRVVSVHASDTSERGRLKHVLLGSGVTRSRRFSASEIQRLEWLDLHGGSLRPGPTGRRGSREYHPAHLGRILRSYSIYVCIKNSDHRPASYYRGVARGLPQDAHHPGLRGDHF